MDELSELFGATSEGRDEATRLCLGLLDVKNEGIHRERVTPQMVSVIRNAAESGNGLALYVMGQLHFGGLEKDGEVLVEDDLEKMMDCYRRGAEAGDMFAQSEYGQELCNGVAGTQEEDETAGFPWIAKSGENGNLFGLHRMTYAYLDGSYGQEVDYNKALGCFERIVSAGDLVEWPPEIVERAKGYAQFLPKKISGDGNARAALGEWLRSREGEWDYTWGLGDADTESEFWLGNR